MTDKLVKNRRSANMSKIKSKDTKPELKVRKALHRLGYRFRLHRKDITGRPDIVLPKYKAAIFVNGCFWHRHNGCREASKPKSNSEYWEAKLNKNVERDTRNYILLSERNRNVIVFWECELDHSVELNTALVKQRLIEKRLYQYETYC
ncbi:MAG: very short patch repair endonuclease [Pyrinomonadaceae bacterium]